MFHINSYMPVCNRTKKYFISPNLGYSSSILPFYVCHLPSTHSYLLCKYLYRFFMLIHIYVPKNYFISSNLGYSSILPFYVCHLTRTHSYVLYKYYIKIADRMDARVEEELQTLTDIAEIGEYMKRETKEEMLKAVSALKNYFTVQEKALTAKSEKISHQLRLKMHKQRPCQRRISAIQQKWRHLAAGKRSRQEVTSIYCHLCSNGWKR